MAICFIDTETTGLDAARHEIIEIAILFWDGPNFKAYFKKISPTHIHTADPKALEINGYNADVWANAPYFKEEAQTIADLICGNTVVGHNVQFDIAFIEKHLKANGVPVPRIRTVDTCTLVHEHLIPIGCPGHGMDKVRAFLGWVRPNAHTAYVDVWDCYKLYQLLCRASVWKRLQIWAQHKCRPYIQRIKMLWASKS